MSVYMLFIVMQNETVQRSKFCTRQNFERGVLRGVPQNSQVPKCAQVGPKQLDVVPFALIL